MMTTYTAQRIRFGILAARHALERWRLTEDQVDFLEGCETVGWAIKYSRAAYDREFMSIMRKVNDDYFRNLEGTTDA